VKQFFVFFGFLAAGATALATVDDAISRAMEAITPYVKEGYVVRGDQWGGDLGVKEQKAIPHTLFKGNDYWFCMATDVDSAKLSIHVYDSRGKLVENDAWQKGRFAASRVRAPSTGTYYIIVEVSSSPAERTHWAMVYGYK
jgi:hypothetical protein